MKLIIDKRPYSSLFKEGILNAQEFEPIKYIPDEYFKRLSHGSDPNVLDAFYLLLRPHFTTFPTLNSM